MGTESKYQAFILDGLALICLTVSTLWEDDDSEEEEEYFEEDYEESFIDDDERVAGGPGSDVDVAPLPLFDREEGDDDVTEVDPPPVVRQRSRQATIIISSDEEDGDDYVDADAHGGYGRSWDEEDEGDYHDACSGSEGHVEHEYWSDGDPNDDDLGFYGYL